jgi:hypothetical protein
VNLWDRKIPYSALKMKAVCSSELLVSYLQVYMALQFIRTSLLFSPSLEPQILHHYLLHVFVRSFLQRARPKCLEREFAQRRNQMELVTADRTRMTHVLNTNFAIIKTDSTGTRESNQHVCAFTCTDCIHLSTGIRCRALFASLLHSSVTSRQVT